MEGGKSLLDRHVERHVAGVSKKVGETGERVC